MSEKTKKLEMYLDKMVKITLITIHGKKNVESTQSIDMKVIKNTFI